MTATDTPKARIEAVADELGLVAQFEFVPFSRSRNKDQKTPSLNWRVRLSVGKMAATMREVLTCDYSAGCGHCPGYKMKDKYVGNQIVVWECENGKRGTWLPSTEQIMGREPIMPELADVISSLVMDADAIDHPTYESWARDLGYDADSRKGEAIYRQCLEIALKLRAAIGEDGLAKLREACQDY